MRQRSATITVHKVHDYLVGKAIAHGSFASIRCGINQLTDEQVAIKLLSKKKLGSIKEGQKILFNEGLIAPLFKHPHLVRIKEVVDCLGQTFIVMDRYPQNLLQYMETTKISFNHKIQLIDQILSAIEYLHSYSICHRDIKLENVMLDENKNAHIGDFGFSEFCNNLVTGCYGSEGYAAPEVFGKNAYDGKKADMYSVGVIMYAILAERKPFSSRETIQKDSNKNIDYSKIPSLLRDTICNLLSIEPAMRPSIKEVRNNKIFEQLPVRCQNEDPCLYDPINNFDYGASLMVKRIFGTFDTTFLTQYGANPVKAVYLLSKTDVKLVRDKIDSSPSSLPHDLMSLCGVHMDLKIFKDPVKALQESAAHYVNNGCCISISHNSDGITLNIVKNRVEKDERLSVEFSSLGADSCNASLSTDDDNLPFAEDFADFVSR